MLIAFKESTSLQVFAAQTDTEEDTHEGVHCHVNRLEGLTPSNSGQIIVVSSSYNQTVYSIKMNK